MPGNVMKMRKGQYQMTPLDAGRSSTGKTGYGKQGGAQTTLGKNPAHSAKQGGVKKQGNLPKV